MPKKLPKSVSSNLSNLIEFAELLVKISLCKNGELDEKDMKDLDHTLGMVGLIMDKYLEMDNDRFVRKIYKFIDMFYENKKESETGYRAGRKHLAKYLGAVKSITKMLSDVLSIFNDDDWEEKLNIKACIKILKDALSNMQKANPKPKVIAGSDYRYSSVSNDVSGVWLVLSLPVGMCAVHTDQGGICERIRYAVEEVTDSLTEFAEKFEEECTEPSDECLAVFPDLCQTVCDKLEDMMKYGAPSGSSWKKNLGQLLNVMEEWREMTEDWNS